MFTLARVTLILALVSAPWMLGAVPVFYQLALTGLVCLSMALWAIATLIDILRCEGGLQRPIPRTLTAVVAFALIGSIQLLPSFPEQPLRTEWEQQLDQVQTPDTSNPQRPIPSIIPSTTRFQVARIIIFGAALFLASQLFNEPAQRNLLYGALALTGTSLALFGMSQKLSWNGELFWSIPLRYGGQPFASFVNRNNASGFLNLCLAACLGGVVLNSTQTQGSRSGLRKAFAIAAVITTCGVIAALSRGGIAAAVIALIVLLPRLSATLGKGFWFSLLGTCAAVAVVTAYLGFQSDASARMHTLDDLEDAMGIRIQHWNDTLPALSDRPWLGSGLGTYREVNRPYQDHLAPGAFWNADNLYFEIAVEAGLAGVVLMAYLLLLILLDLGYLWRMGPFSAWSDVTITGTFALVAVGLQQVTDYGLSLMSLGLVSAVMIGLLTAAASAEVPHFQFSGFARFKAAMTSMILMTVVGLAGYEITLAESSATFRNRLPKHWNSPDAFGEHQLNALIAEGEEILNKRPDDAPMLQTQAELLIQRYRLTEYNRRKNSAYGDPWNQTSLDELYRLANLLPDDSDRERIRQKPTVQENLVPALNYLKQAQKKSDWLKGLHYDLALLSFLDKGADPAGLNWLKRGAVLDANEPPRLVNAGRVAFLHHAPQNQLFSVLCFQRALRLDSQIFPDVMKIVHIVMDDRDVVDKILTTPNQLIAFAQTTRDAKTLSIIAEKLTRSIQAAGSDHSPGEIAWMKAHAAMLVGDSPVAVELLEVAVKEQPLDVDWRLQLAKLLMQEGEYARAQEHLSFAHQVASQRRDIEAELKRAMRGPEQAAPRKNKNSQESPPSLNPTVL